MKNGRLCRPSHMVRRYTPHTFLPQPPDDRTYSAEVTVNRRNLLHHRIAQSGLPNSRSHIIIHAPGNVKRFSGFFPKKFHLFLVETENIFKIRRYRRKIAKNGSSFHCSPAVSLFRQPFSRVFPDQISAISSTSTRAPLGSAETATQLLAGLPVKYLP